MVFFLIIIILGVFLNLLQKVPYFLCKLWLFYVLFIFNYIKIFKLILRVKT